MPVKPGSGNAVFALAAKYLSGVTEDKSRTSDAARPTKKIAAGAVKTTADRNSNDCPVIP